MLNEDGSKTLLDLYIQVVIINVGKLQNAPDILEVMRLIFEYAIPEDQDQDTAISETFDVDELCSSVSKNYEVFTKRVKETANEETTSVMISKLKMIASLVDTKVQVSKILGKSMVENLYQDWICDMNLDSLQWNRVKYYVLDALCSLCKEVEIARHLLNPAELAEIKLSNIISFLVVGTHSAFIKAGLVWQQSTVKISSKESARHPQFCEKYNIDREYEDSFDCRSEGSDFDEARSPAKKGVMSLEGKLHDLCKFTFTKKRKSLELQIQAEKLNLQTEIDHYQLLQSEKLKQVMQDYNNQNENIQTRRKRLKTLMREQCESFRNFMVKMDGVHKESADRESFHNKKDCRKNHGRIEE
ncbi:hypothetical protein GUITHDRAFT_144410 [Guillardia theta CCMP2712]|uniref:Uncharacterized protein n=1 Tax=Guillardia theta (strain CCMP2712) TaxID=905079 RepID=L1IR15_GUITC|nr:hypothetical protein GUITHDRAFT_144410 [Guillardia theta CCMP2712]EKX38304.1 hypothetical protein GUITHDRAFT_144410 [Guillardia theta CCMP2712]|eukprot:XP_005825284.1 hypothetical protein GUITHDRAFT_144410 [Guillardia theta CCMP2712]